MPVPYYGDFAEDDTVLIPFNTFDSNDPSASVTVTDLADADIKVHKDGGTTEIATDGATVAINFDGVTGNHLITIDTSAHADYATGSEYAVRLEGITVDAATLNAWVGCFSIERAGGALAVAKLIQAAVITNAAGVDIAADIAAIEAQTDDIGAAGAGLTAVPWNAAWDAEVQSEVTDALNTYDPPTKAELDSGFAALNDLSAAQVNAEVDTALADYDGPTNAEMEARTLTAARITQLSQNIDNSLQGTCSGTPTTTTTVSDISVTVDDQFKGRTIIFDDDTSTAALQNQATDITGCTASTNTLTFTALTTAPSSGDTFIII